MSDIQCKRAPDFAESGEYIVTDGVRTVRIFRDVEQFGHSVWWVIRRHQTERGGFTKADTLDHIARDWLEQDRRNPTRQSEAYINPDVERLIARAEAFDAWGDACDAAVERGRPITARVAFEVCEVFPSRSMRTLWQGGR